MLQVSSLTNLLHQDVL